MKQSSSKEDLRRKDKVKKLNRPLSPYVGEIKATKG